MYEGIAPPLNPSLTYNGHDTGADPGFSERGSEYRGDL